MKQQKNLYKKTLRTTEIYQNTFIITKIRNTLSLQKKTQSNIKFTVAKVKRKLECHKA